MDAEEEIEPKKILIFAADNIQQVIIERIVTEIGHTVIGSSSEGATAIESALRIGAVDLILMDINLADDIDGIEAAKEINKHRDVKLIYITASKDPGKLERARETNFVDYLEKPLSVEVIEKSFDKAFPKAN